MDLLEGHRAAFEDRDLVTEPLFEDGSERFGSERSADARRRFGVGEGAFAVVLVGRDGGEKFRSPEPVPAERLFDLIDAMPMRRQEIRSRDTR